MSTINHTTTGPGHEGPSNSETAIGGEAGANIVPKDTASTTANTADRPAASQPGSAEAAAEKVFEERMEDEYAKREGGA